MKKWRTREIFDEKGMTIRVVGQHEYIEVVRVCDLHKRTINGIKEV